LLGTLSLLADVDARFPLTLSVSRKFHLAPSRVLFKRQGGANRPHNLNRVVARTGDGKQMFAAAHLFGHLINHDLS
jgi:hypothetical protein